jgi:hypothetical protein
MKRKLGLTAALVVALAMVGYAQKKPDFSGTWTMDAEKSDPAPQGRGGRMGGGMMGGGSMTIKQTDTTFSITREGRQGAMTTDYKLDGSESEISMGRMTAKAKAMWDGDKIVVETTREGQNGPMTTKAIYSIDASGMLWVTNETPNGSRKVAYKKST